MMKGVWESANAHSIVFVNLLALTSNNAFIIKFKMWLGGASHVVVETFSFFFLPVAFSLSFIFVS